MTTHELSAIADSICSRIFDVSVDDIRTGPRTPHVCDARHTAWWLLRESKVALQSIGREYGCHHTTVLEGVKRLNRVRMTEDALMSAMFVCFDQFRKATT